MFIRAASAAVTFGIGDAASTIANFYIRATVSAVVHGTFQGGMTAISGGRFWSGFAAGALSSIASSAWSGGSSMDALGKNGHAIAGTGMSGLGSGTGNLGMIAFGTVSGGAGAELTGGNFWQGAATGLVVAGLNHAMHPMDGDDIDPPGKKKLTEDQKAQAEGWTNAEFKRLYELNESWLEARTFFATLELKLPELEMSSWFGTTSHGAERLAGNLATRGGVLSLREAWTTRILGSGFRQADGATVYLRQLSNGRYNGVVWGERGIITTMKGWSQKSINRIAKNYGWKL